MFTDLLFYAYVEIHQVRSLFFDNYQRYPVPLMGSGNVTIFAKFSRAAVYLL